MFLLWEAYPASGCGVAGRLMVAADCTPLVAAHERGALPDSLGGSRSALAVTPCRGRFSMAIENRRGLSARANRSKCETRALSHVQVSLRCLRWG